MDYCFLGRSDSLFRFELRMQIDPCNGSCDPVNYARNLACFIAIFPHDYMPLHLARGGRLPVLIPSLNAL